MAVLRPFLWFFFANYKDIFHKNEVQTVIQRYLTDINPKSYGIKNKSAKDAKTQKKQKTKNTTQMKFFLQNREKLDMEIFVFCVMLSISKLPSEPQFTEGYSCSWQRNDQKGS